MAMEKTKDAEVKEEPADNIVLPRRRDRSSSLLCDVVQGLQAAQRKPPLTTVVETEEDEEQIPPRRKQETNHKRIVSWGGVSLLSSTDEETGKAPQLAESSTCSSKWNKASVKDSLALRDVMSVSPVEIEAETLILKSLDEYDPTPAAVVAEQQDIVPDTMGILTGVPSTRNSLTEAGQKKTPALQGNDAHSARTVAPSSKAAVTTADRISELAQGLHDLRDANSSSMHEEEGFHEAHHIGPSDAFMKNTVQVLDVIKDNEEEEQDEVAPLMGVSSSGSPDENDLDNMKQSRTSETSSCKNEQSRTRFYFSPRFKDMAHEYELFGKSLADNKNRILRRIRFLFCYLIVPCTGVAALLFYVFGNPPCGTSAEKCTREFEVETEEEQIMERNETLPSNTTLSPASEEDNELFTIDFEPIDEATVSWWILFVGVRLAITFTLAGLTQALVVNYLALHTTTMLRTIGSMLTLFVVQSKGWPFILGTWVVYNFALLYGHRKFPKHWLFWQEYIDLMNDNNYAGDVLESQQYTRILVVCLLFSFLVSIKRLCLGLWLGRQTFRRYSKDLTKTMAKVLWIGKVAVLARDLYEVYVENSWKGGETVREFLASTLSDDGTETAATKEGYVGDHLGSEAKLKITELLGEFEEPEDLDEADEVVDLSAIMQFRQSLVFLNTPYPFSVAFGRADTRENCIAAAEQVYKSLLSMSEKTILHFDTIALLAVQKDGSLDEEALKQLIRLFRPDREGNLSLVDFVKSIDSTYKELRLLRASIKNSSRIDKAFQLCFHVIFYFVLFIVGLGILGIDAWVLFASIAGFLVSFSFMIGQACSKVVEGMLLILLRRPYDIGDRIAVSDVNSDTDVNGSNGWIVKDLNLFSTTVVYGSSNETATYTNSALAASRIINMARSPRACLRFTIKFPIDTEYGKIQVFKSSIEKFVQARPREWASFLAFRATRVEVELGFVEYLVSAIHRESWQQIVALLQSKSDLYMFGLELSKKMGIRYHPPPMPVDLSMTQSSSASSFERTHRQTASVDFQAVSALFQQD